MDGRKVRRTTAISHATTTTRYSVPTTWAIWIACCCGGCTGRSLNGYDGLLRRRSDQPQRDGHRDLNPESTTGVCDISADDLGNKCALRAFGQAPFVRNGTFEHTFGQMQVISTCVTAKALRCRNGGPAAKPGKGQMGNMRLCNMP